MKRIMSKKLLAVVVCLICATVIATYGFYLGLGSESIIAVVTVLGAFVEKYYRAQAEIDKGE